MTKTRTLLFFLLLSVLSSAYAQNTAIGQWRVHLPYNKARLVAYGGDKIYCSAEDGLFAYNKNDNSIETYTKINGLSDIGISVMRYYPDKNLLLVGYENANLDLIFKNEIVNIPDIKRKNILGAKSINGVNFFGKYAYLACGFGIVVIDIDRKEIKDTYYIGVNGNSINVFGIADDGTNLFASTDSGVYAININDPNINFYGSWNKILSSVAGEANKQIVFFNNKIYISVNVAINHYDYLKIYENGTWSNAGIGLYDIHTLQVNDNKMVVTGTFDVKVFDSATEIKSYNNTTYECLIYDGICDNNQIVWLADNRKGLVKISSASSVESIIPDGPHSKFSAGMQIVNDQLWVGHSATGAKWDNLYSGEGFSTFVNNKWTTYDKTNVTSPLVNLDTLYDFMSVAIDPRNSNHVFLGSRGAGLLEFENGVGVKNYYNEANSTLQSAVGNSSSCQLGGIAFDKDYNLWVANSTTASPMSELKADGTWQSFNFPGIFGSPPFLGELIVDSYGQKWMDNNGGGLLVFDDSGTLGPRKYNFLTTDSGGLPSSDVRAIIEDKQGQVWIGTAKGVAVFYSPGSELSIPSSPAQQILLKQDDTYQYLLATEVVTCIAVDGANRKWFGTDNAGVFLMSEDGTRQLLHLSAENTPLLSNKILCMAINQKNGEVFIGTDRGIISYKSDAIEGDDKCHDTYVYPNPVYHDYEGPIAIKGVMNNGNIKITDISGTLVYETTALGGQAIWNGKNFKGEKAHTGVYLVFCSDEDGKNTCITKLLLFN
jgi:type IX secretion system protein PorZ/two component regulator with propeller domain